MRSAPVLIALWLTAASGYTLHRPPPQQQRCAAVSLCAPPPEAESSESANVVESLPTGLPTDLGPLPSVGQLLTQLDPASVGIVQLDTDHPMDVPLVDPQSTFVELFLQCTPYIKMHQDSTMVIHVASEVLNDDALFDKIMEEVAVLALLGVRPVLLVGVRSQIDQGLQRMGITPAQSVGGVRETDEATMRVVQEACGFMRSRVEGTLSRGRSRSGPGGTVGVDVVGGNFFFTAQPVGVRDGKDYGFTGEVRSVDVPKINKHLDNGEIVLLTALGYSASGAIFNVKTEQLAAVAASALGASKLIYMTPERLVTIRKGPPGQIPDTICVTPIEEADDPSVPPCDETSWAGPDSPFVCFAPGGAHDGSTPEDWPVLQSMRLPEVKAVINNWLEQQRAGATKPIWKPSKPADDAPAGEVCAAATPESGAANGAANGAARGGKTAKAAPGLKAPAEACVARVLQLCQHIVRSLELGVTRAHILPPAPGALIQELYTTDGIGTLVSRDMYDGIRLATAGDVPKILNLIEPLEARGVLIKRPPEVLARDVDMGYYYVYTRDDTLLACAQLKRYSASHAELACLVVEPGYRRQGCGDAMLGFMERTAVAAGVSHLFALSTHTMQWFIERGFEKVEVDALPERRVAIYDRNRGSKIYMKPLKSDRLLDAEELFWSSTIDYS